ncbi:MAG: hypothetical protein EXR69_15925 [Myxococcales bacterium]|nr:hypothetical protein [Myxococcales bacterium]
MNPSESIPAWTSCSCGCSAASSTNTSGLISLTQCSHRPPARTFQIEMQRQRHRGLNQRMLHGWSRLYSEQPGGGSEYTSLRPVVSVWVCEEDARQGRRDRAGRSEPRRLVSPAQGGGVLG